jgi:integrase
VKVRDKQTMAAMADEFVERYAKPRNRSWPEYQRILDQYVKPRLGNRPIHELTRRDVVGLLDHVADYNGPVMADHVLAVLRKLCNWHAARDDDFRSPIVMGMARTRPRELARDRILTDDEIRAIWKVLDSAKYPFAPLVKLMFFTAQRRQEVTEARREEIQDDLWTIPAARYKTKRANVVPLPDAASAIIAELPRLGEFLFTTTGRTPFSGFSKAKAHLDEASGVMNWTLHDIRRTARTLMVRIGIRPDIAERVLGHAIPGVAGVYDRHDYIEEKRSALEALLLQDPFELLRRDEVAGFDQLERFAVSVLRIEFVGLLHDPLDVVVPSLQRLPRPCPCIVPQGFGGGVAGAGLHQELLLHQRPTPIFDAEVEHRLSEGFRAAACCLLPQQLGKSIPDADPNPRRQNQ